MQGCVRSYFFFFFLGDESKVSSGSAEHGDEYGRKPNEEGGGM